MQPQGLKPKTDSSSIGTSLQQTDSTLPEQQDTTTNKTELTWETFQAGSGELSKLKDDQLYSLSKAVSPGTILQHEVVLSSTEKAGIKLKAIINAFTGAKKSEETHSEAIIRLSTAYTIDKTYKKLLLARLVLCYPMTGMHHRIERFVNSLPAGKAEQLAKKDHDSLKNLGNVLVYLEHDEVEVFAKLPVEFQENLSKLTKKELQEFHSKKLIESLNFQKASPRINQYTLTQLANELSPQILVKFLALYKQLNNDQRLQLLNAHEQIKNDEGKVIRIERGKILTRFLEITDPPVTNPEGEEVEHPRKKDILSQNKGSRIIAAFFSKTIGEELSLQHNKKPSPEALLSRSSEVFDTDVMPTLRKEAEENKSSLEIFLFFGEEVAINEEAERRAIGVKQIQADFAKQLHSLLKRREEMDSLALVSELNKLIQDFTNQLSPFIKLVNIPAELLASLIIGILYNDQITEEDINVLLTFNGKESLFLDQRGYALTSFVLAASYVVSATESGSKEEAENPLATE